MGFVEVLIIVIFGLLLMISLYILGIYNQLSFYKKKVSDKYETLDKEITNICNITSNVEDLIKDTYGEDKIQDVKIVRRNLEGNKDANERMYKVLGLIKFLDFVAKNIHSNNKLEEYEKEVNSCLENINYAKDFYNDCVNNYNDYKDKKLPSTIAKIFKFPNYNLCTITIDED